MIYLEIEYKTLLTKDEFNCLNNQFSHVVPVAQTDYYFDSENFDMRVNRMSLCIRTLPNRAEITLRIPEEVGNPEYNYSLSVAGAKEIIRSGKFPDVDFLKLIEENGAKLSSLKNFGSLTTTRHKTMTKIGSIALDNNQYAGIKNCELELEVGNAEQDKKDFDNFLIGHTIDLKHAENKVARFNATLE